MVEWIAILSLIIMTATSTIITPELLKTEAFRWDAQKQTPPPERCVCIDAARPALWGNVTLAASAALRCGSPVTIIASGHELGALALALPESTFLGDAKDAPEHAIHCFVEVPESAADKNVIVADAKTALPEASIGISNQSLENTASKSTFAGAWPQLKVLLAEGASFTPEERLAKDGPQPFISGSEFVLAGITSAMLARGLAEDAACVWGMYLFYLTIEAAAKEMGSEGLRASDLIARLPGSLRYATRHADAKSNSYAGLRPM